MLFLIDGCQIHVSLNYTLNSTQIICKNSAQGRENDFLVLIILSRMDTRL